MWDEPLTVQTPAVDAVPDDELEYRYYRPLPWAADEFVAQARTLTSGQRIYTGIDVFDEAMRGLAPKELMVVQGFAHSGKTLFTTAMLQHNRNRRIVLFTADEDRVLVLVKLTSLVTGVSAEQLEYGTANGDAETEALVRDVATYEFPNLAVFDQVNDLRTMSKAMDEVRHAWGAEPELTVFDYLDLLQHGDGDGNTSAKFNAIKAWGKRQDVPLVLLHQASRTGGKDGAEITLTSGAYGGEQQATFVVGVRRKKAWYRAQIAEIKEKLAAQANPSEALQDKLRELEYDLSQHQNTVTFNLVKNKRPPSRLVDEVDFTLDPNTGALRPYEGKALNVRTSSVGRMTAADVVGKRSWSQPSMPDF